MKTLNQIKKKKKREEIVTQAEIMTAIGFMVEKWAGNQEGFNEIYIHGGERVPRS